MIFWSSLSVYRRVVGVRRREEGEELFGSSKLGIEETIFNWLKYAKKVLVKIGVKYLYGRLQLLIGNILAIGKTMREERGI